MADPAAAGLGAATADERTARLETAEALAFAFGWRFFNPFIRAALHLGDEDPDAVQDAIRHQLRQLVADPPRMQRSGGAGGLHGPEVGGE